jgi:leader peptidase (prepilin peptidase)/N-methyltransferase
MLALLGGLVGLLADRVAARWPAHPEDAVRSTDWRSVAVTVAGIVAFGGLGARWHESADLLVLGVSMAVLVVLLATDLDQRLLPDLLTLPLIAYAGMLVVLNLNPLLEGKELALVSALAAGIGGPVALLVTDRMFGGRLGMGDVKLAIGLGVMCGVTRLITGLLAASIAGAIVLLILIGLRRISLRSTIPFGPVLIAAGIIAALV